MSSKLKECPTCGKEVAKSAKICPHCGEKLKKRWFLKALIAIVLLIIAVIVLGPSEQEKATTVNSPSQGQQKATFRITNVKKYSTDHYKYKSKLPLVSIAIENTGATAITSKALKCLVSFIDLDNKRIITQYQRNLLNDFKEIAPGFTSPLIGIQILNVEAKLVKLIGQRPISFRISATVKCELNQHVQEKAVIFYPSEYTSLPVWDW
ncbi:MAG: zinc ribbon domain-containing protein [Thermodesulfobacteriota bacterium]|nr:zinc ribbon domain-containing protein [Thermodesulfobacteriota bacterium]